MKDETAMPDESKEPWFDDYVVEEEESQISEYDLTATPNDFNVLTIFSFIESGAVKIPGFQRNYVWDLVRASKLVESLIMGLPVPQLFLYEEARNRFLVIDGQQRLMSVYYFIKQRFPRKDKRVELRHIFDEEGQIPTEVIEDDAYFRPFKLKLPSKLPNIPNRFHGQKYGTLADYKTQFELRPIRNVIVKQNSPDDDNSSVYEIFNRLNSGGINLSPQEIRTSLYHSDFYNMLHHLNLDTRWRRLLSQTEPDLHMKDVEILLRGLAMLVDSDSYAPSMTRFLNQFSKKCQTHCTDQNQYLERLFSSFLDACSELPEAAFQSKRTKRFSVALFEAAFRAVALRAFSEENLVDDQISEDWIRALDGDLEFVEASQKASTQTSNVNTRLQRAAALMEDSGQ